MELVLTSGLSLPRSQATPDDRVSARSKAQRVVTPAISARIAEIVAL